MAMQKFLTINTTKNVTPHLKISNNYPLNINVNQMSLDARKPVFWGFVNNKGADWSDQMRRLISNFVIRFLESII